MCLLYYCAIVLVQRCFKKKSKNVVAYKNNTKMLHYIYVCMPHVKQHEINLIFNIQFVLSQGLL